MIYLSYYPLLLFLHHPAPHYYFLLQIFGNFFNITLLFEKKTHTQFQNEKFVQKIKDYLA